MYDTNHVFYQLQTTHRHNMLIIQMRGIYLNSQHYQNIVICFMIINTLWIAIINWNLLVIDKKIKTNENSLQKARYRAYLKIHLLQLWRNALQNLSTGNTTCSNTLWSHWRTDLLLWKGYMDIMQKLAKGPVQVRWPWNR